MPQSKGRGTAERGGEGTAKELLLVCYTEDGVTRFGSDFSRLLIGEDRPTMAWFDNSRRRLGWSESKSSVEIMEVRPNDLMRVGECEAGRFQSDIRGK